MAERPLERRQVGVLQARELLLVAVPDLLLGEQPGGGDGDDHERDGEAAEQCERHRQRERPEEL